MSDTDRALSRRGPARCATALRWDRDQLVTAREGDTVSLALLDAGILETSRSAKYRRPRGAYCLRGDCGTCLVRINGLPNRRACLTAVHEGIRIRPQNRLVAGADPSALVDTMLRGGMDHHHFMVRPRVVNQLMQGVARNLTGLGTLPDRMPDAPAQHRVLEPDVLIVGAGSAGRAAHAVLTDGGCDVVWVDRRDRDGIVAEANAAVSDALLDHTGVFGVYVAEGLWAAMRDTPGQPAVLYSIKPRHVVVATGARDPILAVPNNDRPGVVAARGLLQQLRRSDATLAVPAVVIGEGAYATALADALGVEALPPADVDRIEGNPVDAVSLRDGKGKRECQLVALAPLPAPAYELARQAGAAVRWHGGGFSVQRDQRGRCATTAFTVWAAGDVTGYMGPQSAADDGERVAAAVLHSLR
ncbi:MAG: (2Fe-2S)-binding protein [Deltaproteobacteria bacterium]|nr:(2Fe-2S)-binding protein [Deltaproteobacteria bacterium]